MARQDHLDEQEDFQNEDVTGDVESTESQQYDAGSDKQETSACPDCVKNGVPTGLKDASTLCPTCNGSGAV